MKDLRTNKTAMRIWFLILFVASNVVYLTSNPTLFRDYYSVWLFAFTILVFRFTRYYLLVTCGTKTIYFSLVYIGIFICWKRGQAVPPQILTIAFPTTMFAPILTASTIFFWKIPDAECQKKPAAKGKKGKTGKTGKTGKNK